MRGEGEVGRRKECCLYVGDGQGSICRHVSMVRPKIEMEKGGSASCRLVVGGRVLVRT